MSQNCRYFANGRPCFATYSFCSAIASAFSIRQSLSRSSRQRFIIACLLIDGLDFAALVGIGICACRRSRLSGCSAFILHGTTSLANAGALALASYLAQSRRYTPEMRLPGYRRAFVGRLIGPDHFSSVMLGLVPSICSRLIRWQILGTRPRMTENKERGLSTSQGDPGLVVKKGSAKAYSSPIFNAAMKASCGISTLPN
ncbi:hypothetical protein AMK05_CH00282 [Rhizobium sp. N324]|nr:hypothetical protein AMK05_CH00282 [Rhizobium sp. N324]OYD02288.1 hypothetical protein AMK08_CH100277 [Rhizobium sp. N4311]